MSEETDALELARLSERLSWNQVRYVALLWRFPDDGKLGAAIDVPLAEIKQWHTEPAFARAVVLVKKGAVIMGKGILTKATAEAAMIAAGGLGSSNEKIRQDAANALLDRTIGKAVQRVQNESRITIIPSGDSGPFAATQDSDDGRALELDTEAGGSDSDSG
jgi:hypothetical protein